MRRTRQPLGFVAVHEFERAIQSAESSLGVGHQRKVLVPAGQAAGGAQLRQGLRPAPGLVRGDAVYLTHDADPRGEPTGGLRVAVSLLGIAFKLGGHEVAAHDSGQVKRQPAEFGLRLTGKLILGDAVRNPRGGAGRTIAPASLGAVTAGARARAVTVTRRAGRPGRTRRPLRAAPRPGRTPIVSPVAAVFTLPAAIEFATLGPSIARSAVPALRPFLGERAAEAFGRVPARAMTPSGPVGIRWPARAVPAEGPAAPALARAIPSRRPTRRPVRSVTTATLTRSAAAPLGVAAVRVAPGTVPAGTTLVTAVGSWVLVSARGAGGSITAVAGAAVPRRRSAVRAVR